MTTLFALMVSAYAIGALGALFLRSGARSRATAALGTAVGSGAGLALGLMAAWWGHTFSLATVRILPVAGVMLRLDGLGGFFLIIIGLLGLAVSGYGFSYSAVYEGRYSLRMLGAMLNVLMLALSLQVIADNALTFLISWEAMSLAAYWLVLTEHDKSGTMRAGIWYIAMTHAGFVALMAMFLLLSGNDLTTSFSEMRTNAAAFSSSVRNVIFVLALFGFGSK